MTTRVGNLIVMSTRETRLQVAIRLRDAILPKLRTSGSFTTVSGLRVLSYRTAPGATTYFSISLRTPFSGPLPGNDKRLRNWATAGHPLPTKDINLPYGLDVWSK